MKVLVTGACGFVGAALLKTLRSFQDEAGLRLVGIDNLSRNGSWTNRRSVIAAGVQVLHGDIRNASDLEAIGPFDWVIDAAANPSVLAGVDGRSSSRQLIEHNLGGTINLLEACKRWNAGFVLLSTSRVYSIVGLSALPVSEHQSAYRVNDDSSLPPGVSARGVREEFSTQAPISLYGATKLASEQLALEYGHAFNFPVWINRCGVLAGPGQFGRPDQGIFAFWIHSWREKKPLKYIGFGGNGFQVRDCLHPEDVTRLVWKQLQIRDPRGKPQIVNVSGGLESARSLLQISQWCEHRYGVREVGQEKGMRPYDIPWVVLDSTLAKRTWDWQPTISVEAIMSQIASHADANPDWLSVSM